MFGLLDRFADEIMRIAESAMDSPWIYFAIFALAFFDAFFPVVPSETLLIAAGVFAASIGTPNIALMIVAGAFGAFVGDHVAYAAGRGLGPRLMRWQRTAKLTRVGKSVLDDRGAQVLITCRFIPGARTAVTLSAGAVSYPLRRFSSLDLIATFAWAIYTGGVGYIGGESFADSAWMGLAFGIGLAIASGLLIELIRYIRARHAARNSREKAEAAAPSSSSEPHELA